MTNTEVQQEPLTDVQLIDAIIAQSCAKISANGDPHLSLVLLMMWRTMSAHMACAVDIEKRLSALALTDRERSIFQAFLDVSVQHPEEENTDATDTSQGL